MRSSYYISTTTLPVVMILISRYLSRPFLGLAGSGSRDSFLDLADKAKLIEATIRVRLPGCPIYPSTSRPLLQGWGSAGTFKHFAATGCNRIANHVGLCMHVG